MRSQAREMIAAIADARAQIKGWAGCPLSAHCGQMPPVAVRN